MSTKKKLLIAVLAVEVIMITACIVFLFYINSDTVKVNRQLKLAQRYLLEEDYEQAIAVFETIIEIDPKNVEAYIGLAEAYAKTDDLESVVKILERGSKKTDSKEIQKLLDEHMEQLAQEREDTAQQPDAAEEGAKDSEFVSQNGEADSDEANHEEIKEETLFKEYASETLIPTYGIFNTNQNGTMYSIDDEWLNPAGIMDITILDFDLDGKDEMLICHTTQIQNTDFQINMDMYEIVDGKVTLVSSVPFRAYFDNQKKDRWNADITLSKNECADIVFSVNITYMNGEYYIVCEENRYYTAFYDGTSEDVWAMVYQNDELQYAFSYTQTDGGSSDFEYTGYEFVNGQCTNSKAYFSEDMDFDDYAIAEFNARADFLRKQGINVDNDGDILFDESDTTPVFEFTNNLVSTDFSLDYSSITCKFNASLAAYGESLAELEQ